MEPSFANGVSDSAVSVHIAIVIVWICFLRYYLIRDEADHEFQIVFSERGRFFGRVWFENFTYKMRILTLNIHVSNILSFYYIKSNKIRLFLPLMLIF